MGKVQDVCEAVDHRRNAAVWTRNLSYQSIFLETWIVCSISQLNKQLLPNYYRVLVVLLLEVNDTLMFDNPKMLFRMVPRGHEDACTVTVHYRSITSST